VSKLATLEGGRGLAAIAVVLDHVNASTRIQFGADADVSWLDYGKFGVDFFFVLSGFVIVWAHYQDIAQGHIRQYALKRFIRLYPIAWIVVGGWLAIRTMGGRFESIEQIITSLLFVPSLKDPIPTVVWTLRHEVLFYSLFSTLLLSRLYGTIVIGVWGVGCLLHTILSVMGEPFTGMPAFFFSTYHFNFLIGGLLAVIHKQRQFSASVMPLLIALIALITMMYLTSVFSIHRPWLSDYGSFAATGWTFLLGLTFGALLHGLMVVNKMWHPPRLALMLGASSYLLYLAHVPIISILRPVIFALPGAGTVAGLSPVVFLVACLGVCLVGHFLIEAPMTRWLRTMLAVERASSTRAHTGISIDTEQRMSPMTPIRTLRKTLRPIRRLAREVRTRLIELPYLLRKPAIGSADWLIRSEVAYGGFVTGVARQKVSPLDARTADELKVGGMTGGDRMLHHGYAEGYARHLAPFHGAKGLTVAEFGILKGTGLAIWCDLFPEARVLGLDIDLAHFESNRAALVRRGAFKRNAPELHEYDQLVDGSAVLRKLLGRQTLDIVIDDGLHSIDSIITTWRSVRPHLSSCFVYFIEDFPDLLDRIQAELAGLDCRSYGMMTVISHGLPSNGA
jgi:exopolysaccharide production protein ExoZ